VLCSHIQCATLVARAQQFISHSSISGFTEFGRERLREERRLERRLAKGIPGVCLLSPCLKIKRLFSAVGIVLHKLW